LNNLFSVKAEGSILSSTVLAPAPPELHSGEQRRAFDEYNARDEDVTVTGAGEKKYFLIPCEILVVAIVQVTPDLFVIIVIVIV